MASPSLDSSHYLNCHDQDQIPVLSGWLFPFEGPTSFHISDWLRYSSGSWRSKPCFACGLCVQQFTPRPRDQPWNIPWVIPPDICCFKGRILMPWFPLNIFYLIKTGHKMHRNARHDGKYHHTVANAKLDSISNSFR